ncbi:MAG: arsenate reductase family protein [Fibrobacteria bacterium]|nr:arsenate reductase family protein [Fibrobacteria bacterium]
MARPVAYCYSGCGTCRKALAWLQGHGVDADVRAIRETPPARHDLAAALEQGIPLKSLFNVSGGDYKELGLKDKLGTMPVDQALDLLASRGNLVKRPFVVHQGRYLTGFSEDSYSAFFAADRRRT